MFGACAFWGLMAPLGKDAMTHGLDGLTMVSFRVLGGCILFWLTSLLVKKEHVPMKDKLMFIGAAVFGLVTNQCCYTIGLSITSPINASIVTTSMPIFAMILAALILKEPITGKKIGGVLVSLVGVLVLIFNSVGLGGGASETKPMGIVLAVLNGLTFALYLGIFRPLISKYNVVTFMKWMFLFSMLVALPFNARHFFQLPFGQMESKVLWQVAYVVFFATFVAYFLIPVGQKRLRPTLVSMYNYVQPIIATLISILIGLDHITWKKLLAMVLVFAGVWIVNQSRAATSYQN